MFEIIQAGGWLMLPIVLCSVAAVAITAERLWSLQRRKVLPDNLMRQVAYWQAQGGLDEEQITAVRRSSPLGRVVAAALTAGEQDRDILKERVEDTGRHVAHDLGRYLNALGTIADISPLLGLLGTVIGMIKVFTVITTQGVGDPAALAGGISEALITTAAGLTVAIPTLIAYRHLLGRVDGLVVDMEKQAIDLVEALHDEAGARA